MDDWTKKNPFVPKTFAHKQTGGRTSRMFGGYRANIQIPRVRAKVFADFHQHDAVAPVRHERLARTNGKYE